MGSDKSDHDTDIRTGSASTDRGVPLRSAVTALSDGRFEEAETILVRLYEDDPDSQDVQFYLGVARLRMDQPGQALPLLAESVSAGGALAETPDAWVLLGLAAFQTERLHPALEAFRKAVEIAPNHAEAARNLGLVMLALGETASGLEELRRALDLDPENGRIWYSLVQATDLTSDELALLAAIVDRDSQDPFILFAHASAFSQSVPSLRFEALERANQQVNQTIKWTTQSERTILRAVLDHWDRSVDSFRTSPVIGALYPRAIFILGLPRSGTTLLERMLDAHSMVTGGGEGVALLQAIHASGLDPWSKQLCARARDAYWQGILAARSDLDAADLDRLIYVDRTPANFRFIGQIRLAMPSARIIHLTRNISDTALSCYEQFFPPGDMPWSYDPENIGRYFALHDQQMAAWRQRVGPQHWLEIAYEDLVRDPHATMTRLLDFCGLPWDDAVLSHDRQAGAVDRRTNRPVHTLSVGRGAAYGGFQASVLAAMVDETQPGSSGN